MATIEVSTYLPAKPAQVRDHVRTTRLLTYVSARLLRFEPLEPEELPERWRAGRYRVGASLFGVIPIGWQDIVIDDPPPDAPWVVRDNGSGSIARTWDHLIFVEAENEGTRYTDRIEIRAGLLTPLVTVFAALLYRHRQRRWRRLVRNGFDYER